MPTYSEILKQIDALTKQAEEIRQAEFSTALADIKAKMAQFGITIADLHGKAEVKSKRKSASVGVRAKYRSQTGESWSGRGRTPRWLADAEAAGKKRESFLVK